MVENQKRSSRARAAGRSHDARQGPARAGERARLLQAAVPQRPWRVETGRASHPEASMPAAHEGTCTGTRGGTRSCVASPGDWAPLRLACAMRRVLRGSTDGTAAGRGVREGRVRRRRGGDPNDVANEAQPCGTAGTRVEGGRSPPRTLGRNAAGGEGFEQPDAHGARRSGKGPDRAESFGGAHLETCAPKSRRQRQDTCDEDQCSNWRLGGKTGKATCASAAMRGFEFEAVSRAGGGPAQRPEPPSATNERGATRSGEPSRRQYGQ